MIIDIVLAIVLLIGIIKGLRQGLIVALFSFIGLIVALAAALKLSVLVAGYLGESGNISAKWLPLISFLIVFIAVLLIVRMIAKLIESSVELLWLGWINKVCGAILYAVMYVLVFSVVLFFMMQLKLIDDKTVADSVTYQYIQPLAPKVLDGIGRIIPWFRDMFSALEKFFGNLSQNGAQ